MNDMYEPAAGAAGASLTPEQRWTARVAYEAHGLATDQIARLAGTGESVIEALRQEEAWRAASASGEVDDTPGSNAPGHDTAIDLAIRLAASIRGDLDRLAEPSAATGEGALERRSRVHLALVKALRELDELTNALEQAAHARRYPSDVVEFRRELEKRIAALVGEAADTRPAGEP